ncbi:unnamed protein product, partial [marine sediment metagenome]
MNKVAIIIVSLTLVVVAGLSSCTTTSPSAGVPTQDGAPEAPQEVLLIWKSEPVSEVYPPDISGEVSLEPNKASERASGESRGDNDGLGITGFEVVATAGSSKDSMNFYLPECQWIDVIVSSSDLP